MKLVRLERFRENCFSSSYYSQKYICYRKYRSTQLKFADKNLSFNCSIKVLIPSARKIFFIENSIGIRTKFDINKILLILRKTFKKQATSICIQQNINLSQHKREKIIIINSITGNYRMCPQNWNRN